MDERSPETGGADPAAGSPARLIQALWAGQAPLARVFWEYAVVYGSALNLLTTLASLALMTADVSSAVALAVFLLPAPYNVLMVVAVWRSAGRYRGPRLWADLARGAIVLWALIATAA